MTELAQTELREVKYVLLCFPEVPRCSVLKKILHLIIILYLKPWTQIPAMEYTINDFNQLQNFISKFM